MEKIVCVFMENSLRFKLIPWEPSAVPSTLSRPEFEDFATLDVFGHQAARQKTIGEGDAEPSQI